MAKYNSKYNRMTTQELIDLEEQLQQQAKEKAEKRKKLSTQITELRVKARRIRCTLKGREKSEYDGKYYTNSEFRQKYGKTYRELTTEERSKYQREYWQQHKKELKAKRLLRKKDEFKDNK